MESAHTTVSDHHDEHPQHATRVAVTALMSLALVLSMAVAPAAAVQDLGAEQQFLSLINADRRAAGLQELTPVTDIRNVALAWSNQMASERRMSHNPNFYNQYGSWQRAAENVGWTTVSNMNDPSVSPPPCPACTPPS